MPDVTSPPGRPEAKSAFAGRAAARLVARPGISLAASAPASLVVLAALPSQRPAALIPCLLALFAVAVLVLAAELASFDARDARPQVAVPQARHTSWADPAMVSVERWLTNWPGLAGVSAVSWWAARVGAAGLLSQLAFSALGVPSAAAWAAAAIACLTFCACASAGRQVVHVGLGVVAISGLVATLSGAVAALEGHLGTALAPAGPTWPSAHSASSVIVQSTTTVALIGLLAVSLVAVTPATSGDAKPRRKWVIWAAVGTAVCTWAFALPLLMRGAGMDLPMELLEGRTGALRSALADVLSPLGGAHAMTLAGVFIFAACLAGAAGAISGATGLAESAVHAARAARSRGGNRSAARSLQPGAGERQVGRPAAGHSLPWTVVLGTALATAAASAAVAWAGSRTWLLVALGGLATGALALTTLAPPVLRQCQRVPSGVRASVAGIWALVITVGIGAAGPLALAVVGPCALGGAFVIGWRGTGRGLTSPRRHLSLPWSTIAAAVVTAGAVTAMELLPAASKGTAPGLWQGLAVVVMGAGIVVLAVFPATSRQRAEHLSQSALVLATRSLPALAAALEGLANGEPRRVPVSDLSDLRAATRPLEAELGSQAGDNEFLSLAQALVEASNQVVRLKAAVDAVAQMDSRRLEELVEERLSALSHANRKLVDSQWRRRQLLDRTVRVAEGERARIAANIHDGPIQRLAAIGLVLDRCRLRLDREDGDGTRELMKRARAELSDEIHNLRRMMSELRPPILDEGGLEAALRDHLSGWSSATGIEARLESAPYGDLTANSEMVVYRVVQESLANVAKHARAKLTIVTLAQAAQGVQVVIRDDGRGFSAQSQPDLLRGGHFGLVVMRERVELAAGRFEVKSAPRTGTEVVVWLPTSSSSEPVEAA